MPSDSSRAASTRARNAPATQVRGAIRTRPSMTECYDRAPLTCGAMPPRSPWLARRCARSRSPPLVALVPGAAFATRAPEHARGAARDLGRHVLHVVRRLRDRRGSPPSSRRSWRSPACSDATEGAAVDAPRRLAATRSAAAAHQSRGRATAASANGVPDVTNGKQLAHEIEQTLVDTSTAYAKAAKQSSSLPTAPKKLSAAVKKIAKQLAAALDPSSPHAKRLEKLDRGNTIAKAISSDPTLRGRARRCPGSTTPATPAHRHALNRRGAERARH